MSLEHVEVHQHELADPQQREVLHEVLAERAEADDEDLRGVQALGVVPSEDRARMQARRRGHEPYPFLFDRFMAVTGVVGHLACR